uniref:Uncharacterized protein n=1 Tax=Oryza sativa subsp. japonica TaxID=39947 RepID=Q2R0I5_ORYSJ|nr:hypothetical protein LOC_Os11g42459 [Oryza sativa Japonica Group]
MAGVLEDDFHDDYFLCGF